MVRFIKIDEENYLPVEIACDGTTTYGSWPEEDDDVPCDWDEDYLDE